MLCQKVVRSLTSATRAKGTESLVSKRWLFPGSSPTDQTTEKTWSDDTKDKNQTPEGVRTVDPTGAKIELHVPKTVGPGDPVEQLDEATLEYNLPAAPPGAHKPRHTGSNEFAPMDADAYVGPAGATTGPAGKISTPFEQISKRRMSTTAFLPEHIRQQRTSVSTPSNLAKQALRNLSDRVEVNPGGGRVVPLDLQHDSQVVVDAAVEEFSDEKGSFGSGAQWRAGQAQADSMGTGGFLNPPPGQVFDDTHTTPDIPVHGTPGTIKGTKLDAADADGAFGAASQTGAGHEQAEGMGTGGCLNPPPEEVFTGGGLSSTSKDASGSTEVPMPGKAAPTPGSRAPLKDPNYSVSHDSLLPPGAAGLSTAPAWFSAAPATAENKTPGAGPKKDSYEEVKHLPDRPEPVDAGIVTDLQTGVNVLGGTPVKPQAERMTHPDQLHRDTESMQPEIDPRIEKLVPDETTSLAGRPH